MRTSTQIARRLLVAPGEDNRDLHLLSVAIHPAMARLDGA